MVRRTSLGYSWWISLVSVSNSRRLGRNSSDLPQKRKFSCVCRYVCKSFAYKLLVFPNMVLGKLNVRTLWTCVIRFNSLRVSVTTKCMTSILFRSNLDQLLFEIRNNQGMCVFSLFSRCTAKDSIQQIEVAGHSLDFQPPRSKCT